MQRIGNTIHVLGSSPVRRGNNNATTTAETAADTVTAGLTTGATPTGEVDRAITPDLESMSTEPVRRVLFPTSEPKNQRVPAARGGKKAAGQRGTIASSARYKPYDAATRPSKANQVNQANQAKQTYQAIQPKVPYPVS